MSKRNWLIYKGMPSKDFGVYLNGNETFNGAERDITTIEVPGRNGNLTIDNGRFKNITITYHAFIFENFSDNTEAYRNLLLSTSGYNKLEDTFHPEEYRMARFSGGFIAEPKKTLEVGGFDIVFDCMPQRFLKSGDNPIELTASGSIRNPHLMEARPLIRVYGVGTVTVGNVPITVTANESYIDIDCETESAYCGSTNLNGNIVLSDGKFWRLSPGYIDVVLGTGVTKVIIYPKWWLL